MTCSERFSIFTTMMALIAAPLAACGGDDHEGPCVVGTNAGCEEGLVCEPVTGAEEPACFGPVSVRGRIFDSTTGTGIEGARVVALDVNSFARSDVTFSGADGSYSLPVPVERDAEGNPVGDQITLRVSANGYQSFPTAPRTALPIDLSTGTAGDGGARAVMNAATDVALIPLEGGAAGLGTIRGRVDHPEPGGVLVVAEQGTTAVSSSITDSDGDFVLFNVPNGPTLLDGYREGINVEEQTVEATGNVTNVVLAASSDGLSTVAGTIQIVNAPGGLTTSVILAVESTFVENAARGEAPAGLRAQNVSSSFSIEGVPPGRYVVLAAFENDDLVRDPDTGIGGTAIVHVGVPEDLPLSQSFKVTEALAVVRPGRDTVEEISTPTPVLEWADDSSEDGYEVYVFDAYGNQVHLETLGSVSGASTVSYTYDGPALEEGMLYQFRAHSFRGAAGSRSYISSTEDLRGVFLYRP